MAKKTDVTKSSKKDTGNAPVRLGDKAGDC